MDPAMVVVVDERIDGSLERAREVVVLEQDPVLQRLMPAFDLALGLRMLRRPAHVVHPLVAEPFGEIAGDAGRAVVAEKPRPVQHRWLIAAGCCQASSRVSVTSLARMVVQSFQAITYRLKSSRMVLRQCQPQPITFR